MDQHHDLEIELFLFIETHSTNKDHFMSIVCATRKPAVQTHNVWNVKKKKLFAVIPYVNCLYFDLYSNVNYYGYVRIVIDGTVGTATGTASYLLNDSNIENKIGSRRTKWPKLEILVSFSTQSPTNARVARTSKWHRKMKNNETKKKTA